jgi:hypothetical protein
MYYELEKFRNELLDKTGMIVINKVKLSPCPTKHYAMRAYGGVDV